MLSGNRNFEGRISQDVKANYLASPPLVVAYALAGRMDIDITTDPLGEDSDGNPVYLSDIWPSTEEIAEVVGKSIRREMFTKNYGEVFKGNEDWQDVSVPEGDRYTWPDSTYVRRPAFFEGMPADPPGIVTDRPRPACWPCSAIRSPPTTSRLPARSRSRARPVNG